ncbi:MAG: hypothetical protein COB81_06185 [Flavobacteriaceae bacterium]|nr:MAG: hypothetical protein COB81_06185 [Flavobacteriaceae bacterium]
MKKIIGILVLVMAVTFSVNAQERNMRKKMDHPNFTPEQHATIHTKKMTLALDLTAGQQREIHTFHLATVADRKAMKTEFRKARESDVKLTDSQKYERTIAKLDKQIAHKSKMKSILNKEQYQKWSKMHGQKMRQHGKHMRKGAKRTEGKKRMHHKN